MAAAKVSRESWVTEWEESDKKLRLRDQGLLNDLLILAEAELKTLGTGSSRSVAPTDPNTSQDLILAMALAGHHGAKEMGIDVSLFPGLDQRLLRVSGCVVNSSVNLSSTLVLMSYMMKSYQVKKL